MPSYVFMEWCLGRFELYSFPLVSGICILFSEVSTKINKNALILENILSFSDLV